MAQGTHPLASQEDDHLCQAECILVQYQIKDGRSETNEKVQNSDKNFNSLDTKIGKTQFLNANYWKFKNLQVFFTPLTFYDHRLTIFCLR